MSKAVVSWLAFNKDFIPNASGGFQINTGGPTVTIHNFQVPANDYKTHYLLQCKPGTGTILEKKIKRMVAHLNDHYPAHKIELRLLDLAEEDLSNYEIVSATLRAFMNTIDVAYKDIDVITGTGSGIMQMAWVALFYSMSIRFHLYLMHHNPVKFPNPIPVNLTKSVELDNKIKEVNLRGTVPPKIVSDKSLKAVYEKSKIWAEAIGLNVLILGETGTGKDLLAKYIVESSPRHDRPYEAINCAALPEDNLLYSELFGHVKGAFTGADKPRKGLFQKCKGGTIFLDEIGDISYRLQVTLLRAIENKEIKPLGADEVVTDVNVRIISATNANLLEKCERGEFRWDLYFRLRDCELRLQTFRDRNMVDRKALLTEFLGQAEKNWKRQLSFTNDAANIFYNYTFPGNFREIRSTINSFFASNKKLIERSDLPELFFRRSLSDIGLGRIENEKKLIERAYQEANFNIAETARKIQYSNPHKLKEKMIKLGIEIQNTRGRK